MRNELLGILKDIVNEPTNLYLKFILRDFLQDHDDARLGLIEFYLKLYSIQEPQEEQQYSPSKIPSCPEELRFIPASPYAGFHSLGRLVSVTMLERIPNNLINKTVLSLWFMKNCFLVDKYAPLNVYGSNFFQSCCTTFTFGALAQVANRLGKYNKFQKRINGLCEKIIENLEPIVPWGTLKNFPKNITIINLKEIE